MPAAFIGLALIAALSDRLTKWDEYPVLLGTARTYTLKDSSAIRSEPVSWISVRQTPELRFAKVALGEAEFDVAKDVDRPFRVRATPWTYEAVGTKFKVQKKRGASRVSVLEGDVIGRMDGGASGPVLIKTGYSFEMSDTGTVAIIAQPPAPPIANTPEKTSDSAEPARVSGTVGELVAHFAAQPGAPRIRATSAASSLQFFATMPPNDAERFLANLRLQPNLTVSEVGGEHIVDVKTDPPVMEK